MTETRERAAELRRVACEKACPECHLAFCSGVAEQLAWAAETIDALWALNGLLFRRVFGPGLRAAGGGQEAEYDWREITGRTT